VKRLVRILLVNWYRIDQIEIEIEGHTAVIGPNASGKSSLLDAIQAVLVGGHKDWWRPNASASERSTRSLRDYCLGVVRDPDNQDLSAAFRPRPQAITYPVLVFRDDAGEPISVGLALHARLEESSEQIDGRFIAPGLDLRLVDLTDRHPGGGVTPRPWLRLREDLRTRAGSRLILEGSPEKFQRQICAVLSDGRRHLDRKRFLRAFRNAITFAPIRNVSDFVRGQILEERDIQVRSLQQALGRYREISRRAKDAKRREDALEEIDRFYRKAEQAERLAMDWRWVEQESLFNALEAELEPLREAIERRDTELKQLQEERARLDQAWNQADEAFQEANRQLGKTDVEQRRETIKARRETAEQGLRQARETIDQARRALGLVHRLVDHAELLDDIDLAAALRDLAVQLPGEDLLADAWPLDATGIAARISAVAPGLEKALQQQRELRNHAISRVAELRVRLEDLRTRIKQMEETGGSDLSRHTRDLIALLQQHGIAAVPLCDRVEVRDEHWRGAVESFLGGHREALLVAPGEVRDAILHYRHEGRQQGIHGSRIINTRKTAEWLSRRQQGSLAEVVDSADEHAIAYINRRAGNVLRVLGEEELAGQERAITSDGMLATGGAVTRLQPLAPMLGRDARERALASLKEAFQADAMAFGEAKETQRQRERLIDELLTPFKGRIDAMPDWYAVVAERQTRLVEIRELEREELELLDDETYRRLKQQVAAAGAHRDAVDRQRQDAATQHEQLARTQDQELGLLTNKERESDTVVEQRRLIEGLPGFDAASASAHLEELEAQMLLPQEGPDAWRAMAEKAAQRADTQTSKMHNRRIEARDELREYLGTWPSEEAPSFGFADDHLSLAAWVVGHLRAVRDTELARYATEASTALHEAETAFRADFVGKLQENLHLLEAQRKELNANLRHRPFHGQYYHFVKKADRELEPVLQWVESWTPEQAGDVGGLFDAGSDPSHPHYEAIAQIKSLLMAAGEDGGEGWDERLADYRQYYHFDVKMTDDKDGEKNAEMLSRRIGKGSGGEHQSPFYVAIGAALAAAYRIERDDQGGYRGGIGLAVFDEAFSKLDLQNTVSALGFLDELGLQVLLAAPDEKYGQIAEHVDTIVNVYRDGGEVFIDTEYIKPEARLALAADNPAQRPGQTDNG